MEWEGFLLPFAAAENLTCVPGLRSFSLLYRSFFVTLTPYLLSLYVVPKSYLIILA